MRDWLRHQSIAASLAAGATIAILTAFPLTLHAQRFEGIITFKFSPGAQGGRGAPANGRAGQPVAGANAQSGRGATVAASGAARGGARGETRAQEGRGGRGELALTDAQADAMRNAFSGNLQNIEYMTRRGRVRIGIAAAAGGVSPAAMIYAPEDNVMFTLLPAVSMYSETAIGDIAAFANQQASAIDSARTPQRAPIVRHTKKFELIAGHRCEHVTIEVARQKTDVCMGKGLGVFVMPPMMGRTETLSSVMADANGFPLKVTQPNGTVTMEVMKIERKALPEALFHVPDTYTKMPDILRRPPG